MSVKPIPDGFHAVTPFLLVKGVSKLLDFLGEAFGAEEDHRQTAPDGTIRHAQISIGDSKLMLGEATDEYPEMPTMLYLYVEDVDAMYQRAVAAGATSLREPTDEFYGDRSSGVLDPSGNQWWIATHKEDVPSEEVDRRAAELFDK
jgi:uncharacterized glyoxalase superfamily protein PhnB